MSNLRLTSVQTFENLNLLFKMWLKVGETRAAMKTEKLDNEKSQNGLLVHLYKDF